MKTLVFSPTRELGGARVDAGRGHRLAHADRLRRAEGVDDHGVGEVARAGPASTASENMTPDDVNTNRLERSQRSGSASRARSIGLAKASPTMAVVLPLCALDGVEQLLDVEVRGSRG